MIDRVLLALRGMIWPGIDSVRATQAYEEAVEEFCGGYQPFRASARHGQGHR